MSDVEEVGGMAIVAGPMAAVNARNKRNSVEVRTEDPLRQDWKELTFTDSWNLPAVYDFGANELLARELERWAKQFGGPHGQQLRRRAAWLRSDKAPRATSIPASADTRGEAE